MKEFDYRGPNTLEQALEILQDTDTSTCIIAGGTDLTIKLGRGGIQCDRIISLKKVRELSYIHEENGMLHIGSMCTHEQIASNLLVRKKATVLAEACGDIGSLQIRNLGTVGGNIVTSSAAADSVTALMALDASCVIRSLRTQRTVPLAGLFGKNGVAQIGKDELLEEVFFKSHRTNEVSGFKKLGRRKALAIVVVSIGIIMEKESDNFCRQMRIALGGISRTPCRVADAEQTMFQKEINKANLEACLREVSNFTVDSLEKSPFTYLIPHKRHAVIGIGREVLQRLCPDAGIYGEQQCMM